MHATGAHDGPLLPFTYLDHPQIPSWSIGPTLSNTTGELPTKLKSLNAPSQMAASHPHSASPVLSPKNGSEESLSLPPDLGNTSSSDLSFNASSPPRPIPLNDEVEKLNDKLITAINHQTELEDTLVGVRHELDESRNRLQQLEAEARAEETKASGGLLIPRVEAETEKARLLADLNTERKQKDVILQEKRGIEREIEGLTASLFEEANEMVAAANRDKDAVERKNQQLRDQVKDTEALLANQQEQLTELKTVMQQMRNEVAKDEGALSTRDSVAPSSPSSYKEKDTQVLRLLEAMNLSSRSVQTPDDVLPAPSTALTHLLKPVCRTDIPAYEEFRHFLLISQKSRPASRVASGSYAGLNVASMSALTSSTASLPHVPTNNNVASTPVMKDPTSPQLPGSFTPNVNANASCDPEKTTVPLKETKFYKRLLAEDIEPALRLDLSPDISWLSKRSILAALTENGLIAEPISERSLRLYARSTPCALCGEARRDDANPRTHHMRVSDDEGASRWALCVLCLEKIRASCELVGYVRMVRDGVVRCGDGEEEQDTWEELIRLRERLFWARMAGGVVPSFVERVSDKCSPSIDTPHEVVKDAEEGEAAATHDAEEVHDSAIRNGRSNTNGTSPSGDDAASGQLHRDLSNSIPTSSDPMTSIPGIRDITPRTPPRFPTGQKRGSSWSNLKISVPRAFASLRDDVNVLH